LYTYFKVEPSGHSRYLLIYKFQLKMENYASLILTR